MLGLRGDLVVGVHRCVLSLDLAEMERGYPLSEQGRLERAFSNEAKYPAVRWRRAHNTEGSDEGLFFLKKNWRKEKITRKTCFQGDLTNCPTHGRFPKGEIHTDVAVSAHEHKCVGE